MIRKIFMFAAAFVFAGQCAFADCETRPTTQAERDLEVKTRTAVKNAMPAAPSGWNGNTEISVKPQEATCRAPGQPVDFQHIFPYLRDWRAELTPKMKELKETNAKRAADRSKRQKEYTGSPEYVQDDKKVSENTKLSQDAVKRLMEAMKNKKVKEQKLAGAEIEKLGKERDAIFKKREKFYADIHAEAKADSAAEDIDTRANITVSVNDAYSQSISPESRPFAPSNAKMAFYSEKPRYEGISSSIDSTVRLYYGEWVVKDSRDGEKKLVPPSAAKGSGPQVLSIWVEVTANDKDRAIELAKKINLDSIKGLVAQ